MDPYFEIYIPRLTRTLKLSKLRALTKLHNPKRTWGQSSACWKEMARAAGRTANTTTAEVPTRATQKNARIPARNTTSTCAVRRLVLMYARIVATPARQKSGGRCASCHSTTQKCHRVARVKGRHHDQR